MKREHLLGATSNHWLPPLLILFVALALFASLNLRGGWIEPDAYAFYNRACLDGLDFDTPILSKIFFDNPPCDLWKWFLAQSALMVISVGVMAISLRKFFGAPSWTVWMIGTSVFVLQFFTAFEDDHLAFPIVMILCWWYLSKPTTAKAAVLIFSGLILSFFVWKGAIVPISLTVAIGMNPLLALVELGFLWALGHLGNDIGGSTELTHGYGFFANLLPWAILYFYQDVKKEVWENRNLLYGSIIFLIVSFLQAKWGLYTIIPLVPFIIKIFSAQPQILRKICTLGALGLLVMPSAYLFFQAPQSPHWDLIKEAKSYQDEGKIVLNYWSVGRYFQFVGGTPSQAGGNSGPQDHEGEWYWLGPERPDCLTIRAVDLLFFQKCE